MMKNTKRQSSVLISAVLLVTLGTSVPMLSGCNPATAKDDASQLQMAGRLDEIMKKSGGEWTNVSEADKNYLVGELGQGNARSAEMLFKAKAGKLRITQKPSGPPRIAR